MILVGKISENRFARADLEHILLCVDDDMRMEALRQTNYVKSIVTAQGKMDLERKGKQSYQGWMFARLLAFSNGDLQALYDRSDGFYRRQLVLTTKEKPADRADDPDLAEKMKAEAEGVFLWAFEGLQRLVANNFKFTESDRTPIMLAAVGGLLCFRAGVFNIGLEGLMLVGSFAGVAGVILGGGSVYVGFLVAILAGILMAALFALASVKLHANEIVVSLAINMLALGLTSFLLRAIFDTTGALRPDTINKLTEFELPLLGKLIGKQSIVRCLQKSASIALKRACRPCPNRTRTHSAKSCA